MTTPAEARFTEAHRLLQIRIGAQTVQQLVSAFALLDPSNLDRTVADWLRVAVPVIRQQRRLSATVAGRYLQEFRTARIGGSFTPVLADDGDTTAITTSLVVTGPVSIKAAMLTGTPLTKAADIAMAASAAAGMRHALNGGRDTLVNTAKADRRVTGWVRITSGNACQFCEDLAGNHDVHGDFQAHDGCTCTAELAYS